MMDHKKKKQSKAMERAQLIMKVRCGQMTAAAAAAQLGVSRKTYFKWEQRGLAALLDGLSDQQPGRPENQQDPAQAVLEKQLADLKRKNQLLEQKMILKDLAAEFDILSKDRTKKNEQIKQMVHTIEAVKSRYAVPAAPLAAAAGLSASSYKRWKRRMRCGKEPVQKPGAKKVAPIDLKKLKQKITDLHQGRKRTAGTVRVYLANGHGISRRQFNEMVRQVRNAHNRLKSASLCRVHWLYPDLAWALDGLEYTTCHIYNLQDLCSRYKFAPMTSEHVPCGEEIAGHLDRHFARFGPPLFIKRDNGGNLNHRAGNAILEELLIIPINSPFYRASYNGAIEHSQGELKTWIGKRSENNETDPAA